jgi:methionyl-tRNA synthetase
LNEYQDWLKEWILVDHKNDWKTNVLGQVKSWIDDGLKPRAVTRDLDWGIPVPVEGGEGKVLYVWFDAPIGYISSTKEWAAEKGKQWEPYWKDKDSKLVHFIGKDNIVFHCVIFPAMLKAEGSYVLPDNVPANEFLNLEGDKISTSKNWAVWLHEYLIEFPGMQDVLRYVLTANAPESKDNDFTWKDFQARNNNELVAIFGNFINRVVVLTNKYYEGVVPEPEHLTDLDTMTLRQLSKYPEIISSSLERYRFREGLSELMNLARMGNKYLADEEPWKKIKTDPERVKTIMNVALQIASGLSVLCAPFLPFTSAKLRKMLNLQELRNRSWNDVGSTKTALEAGHVIGKAELLFSKIEDKEIQVQIDKLQASKASAAKPAAVPLKETISFEDFTKLDIRIGTILEAEKIPKTKKLLKLKVDVGIDVRTIVSGIAESFSAEDVIGQKVTVLVNLAPRKLRGVESQGMILMSDTSDGRLSFIEPDSDSVGNGERIS